MQVVVAKTSLGSKIEMLLELQRSTEEEIEMKKMKKTTCLILTLGILFGLAAAAATLQNFTANWVGLTLPPPSLASEH